MEPIQKVLLWVTAILATIVIGSSLILGIGMIRMRLPDRPQLSDSTNSSIQESKGKEISNYKELVETEQAKRTRIYDYTVLQTMLPLLTSLVTVIITYIFATKAVEMYTAYLSKRQIGNR